VDYGEIDTTESIGGQWRDSADERCYQKSGKAKRELKARKGRRKRKKWPRKIERSVTSWCISGKCTSHASWQCTLSALLRMIVNMTAFLQRRIRQWSVPRFLVVSGRGHVNRKGMMEEDGTGRKRRKGDQYKCETEHSV